MNANKLADELEEASTRAEDHGTIAKRNRQAATMLRLQHALIYQRDDEIKALYNLVTEQDKKIIDLAFKLAYAERSNEVVAELYTHPVKELDRELLDKTIIDQQNEIKVLREQLRWALIAKKDVGHNFNIVSLQLQQKAQEK